ncbi:MAG TPA: rhomboid family intramembrane serine protease [Chitinophagaceae bacterium]|jgi:membrane associated rhomboid family serine protease
MSDFKYYRQNNFPPVIKNLVIINAIIYIAQVTFDKSYNLTQRFSLYPIISNGLKKWLEEQNISYYGFHPFQIFTHMFSHSPTTIFHILFNMLVLWMFGRVLENVWGGKRFLFFYLACGVGAAALNIAVQSYRAELLWEAVQANDQAGVDKFQSALAGVVGASGAIMGIMAAFAYLFPNTPLLIIPFPFPIKAKWLVLIYVAYDLIGGLGGIPGDNIAHFAHLGGAITGFIIVFIWNKTNRRTLY